MKKPLFIMIHKSTLPAAALAVLVASASLSKAAEEPAPIPEGVYVEKTQGRAAADAWFADVRSSTLGPGSLYRGDGVDSQGAYTGLIYSKGARVLNTLLFEMKRRDAKKGLATLCIGGGMGVALCVERP